MARTTVALTAFSHVRKPFSWTRQPPQPHRTGGFRLRPAVTCRLSWYYFVPVWQPTGKWSPNRLAEDSPQLAAICVAETEVHWRGLSSPQTDQSGMLLSSVGAVRFQRSQSQSKSAKASPWPKLSIVSRTLRIRHRSSPPFIGPLSPRPIIWK